MDGILIDLAIVTAVVGTVIFIEFVEDVEAEERADDWAGRGRSPTDPILHRTRAAAFRDFNGFRLRPNIHGEFQFCYQRLPWRNLQQHADEIWSRIFPLTPLLLLLFINSMFPDSNSMI